VSDNTSITLNINQINVGVEITAIL